MSWPCGAGSSVRWWPWKRPRSRRACCWTSAVWAHLFGGEEPLARTILRRLAERSSPGLIAIAAVADTLAAAWAVAHFTRSAAPPTAGLPAPLIVPPGQTPAALRGLPVAALRLPDAVVELLHQVGVRCIGQLEQLPRDGAYAPASARSSWTVGTRPWAGGAICGRCSRPRRSWRPTTFANFRSPAARRCWRLSRTCWADWPRCWCGMARGPCASSAVCVSKGRQTCPSVWGLFQPTAAAAHLLPLLAMQLERLSLPGPVTGVRVEMPLTAPPERRQQTLFDDDQPQHQRPGCWRR